MNKQKDRPQVTEQNEVIQISKGLLPQKPSAIAFDRDKNLFYWANDESVDEILDSEGYHVVHANRKLKEES